MSAASASEVLLTTQRGRRVLRISARVAAGRYTVDAGCKSTAAKRYQLTIIAATAGTGTQSAGG